MSRAIVVLQGIFPGDSPQSEWAGSRTHAISEIGRFYYLTVSVTIRSANHVELLRVRCPECNATIDVRDIAPRAREVVECSYCGTSSLVQHRTRYLETTIPQQNPEGMSVAVQLHSRRWVAGIGVLSLIAVGAIGVFGAAMNHRRLVSDLYLWHYVGPIVSADGNGDGVPDPFGQFLYPSKKHTTLVAIDGATGMTLWESSPLGPYDDTVTSKIVPLDGKLLVVHKAASFQGFSAQNGARLWRGQFPDKPDSYCEETEGRIFIRLVDQSWYQLRTKDGTVEPLDEEPPCTPVSGGHWSRGGRGVQTYYRHHHPKPQRFDGMRVAWALHYEGQNRAIALGHRTKGTSVPMVAAYNVENKTALWKQQIPSRNPLAASQGAPKWAAVSKTHVAVAYQSKNVLRVTTFLADDGTRLWDVLVPSRNASVTGIGLTDKQVYVSGAGFYCLDLLTGKQRYAVGTGD